MKILVSAQAPDISAPVDPRFGRAAWFVIVDVESGDWTAEANAGVAAGHGAGIDAARYAAEQGAEAILTGAAGPNAFRTLEATGLAVYAVDSGSVEEAVAAFRNGTLPRLTDASVPAHFGSGESTDSSQSAGSNQGASGGRGMGGGRGVGRGGGRGMGGGRGTGRGAGRGMGGGRGMGSGRGAGRDAGQGLGDGMSGRRQRDPGA